MSLLVSQVVVTEEDTFGIILRWTENEEKIQSVLAEVVKEGIQESTMIVSENECKEWCSENGLWSFGQAVVSID